jgi:glyoxylase-like metal-dependent hydrolase (beta-lactamase superfamily II)
MVTTLDLDFLGRPGVIASGLLEWPRGSAVVDPGPASGLGGLRAALAAHGHALEEVETILVTHIHLDHSGAVGVLVRANPRIQVYVHERGAPHVIDPSKLVSSATRLYGESMERLWGEIAPVPAANVHALKGGEVLRIAGAEVRVAYTPGHASHHVSFFDASSGTAFVGDTGGIRVGTPLLVIPPTPPPDIDVAAWDASLDLIRAWEPQRVFLTHFGGFDQPLEHLADLQERLHQAASDVQSLLADESLDDTQRQARFVARAMRTFQERLPDEDWVQRYQLAVPLDHCWQGLVRYWRKQVTPTLHKPS